VNTEIEMPVRKIGDVVWIPKAETRAVYSTCPDCLGTAKWHCVLPNGEEFDAECPRCYPGGYLPSTGRVCERHEHVGFAEMTEVVGVERDSSTGEIKINTKNGWHFKQSDVFDDEASAVARSVEKAREWHDEQDAQMAKVASKRGRARVNRLTGCREATTDFPGNSINYARQQCRKAIDEALRWVRFAKNKHSDINLVQMLEKKMAGKEI